jgi:hypothetical protein
MAKAKQKNAAMAAHEAKMAALRALEDRNGCLRPDSLVRAARVESHPWHENFEWDDAKASDAYRIIQARDIIRNWAPPRITSEVVERRTPKYLHDPRLPHGEQGYVSIAKVRSDEDLKREVLVAEFSRAQSALQRAYDIADILNAREEIADLVERVNALRERGATARL